MEGQTEWTKRLKRLGWEAMKLKAFKSSSENRSKDELFSSFYLTNKQTKPTRFTLILFADTYSKNRLDFEELRFPNGFSTVIVYSPRFHGFYFHHTGDCDQFSGSYVVHQVAE